MTGAPISTPIVKKVPGKPVKFDYEKDGYVSLSNLTKTELLDLLHREEKLSINKKFLEKLPDKGEKVKKFLLEIKDELRKRDEHDKLCGLLAELDVNESKNALDKLEWTGRFDNDDSRVLEDNQDTSPFKILATHSSTCVSKDKQIKVLESGTDVTDTSAHFDGIDAYAKQLCQKFSSSKPETAKKKFFTHRSLNATSIEELIEHQQPEVNETKINTDLKKAKMLSLPESITIQQEQIKQLKEVEFRRAIEKLSEKNYISILKPKTNTDVYREQSIFDSDDECSQRSESRSDNEECD